MFSEEIIKESLEEHVRYSKGNFYLRDPWSVPEGHKHKKISPERFLIPLIEKVNISMLYGIESSPRNLGKLVEILRSCSFCSAGDGKVGIYPDRQRARSMGAFDTPEPVVEYITETVLKPLVGRGTQVSVVDPAVGAGYFLIKAVEVFGGAETGSLMGLDIDPVAVALARRNLKAVLEEKFGRNTANEVLKATIRKADALADFSRLPIKAGSVDAVIGNPPYQFFSGRGSEVARLKAEGKNKEAEKVQAEIDKLIRRFPETSSGCRDRYKWFVQRAVDMLRKGGRLGFIVPNTWIAYPRYTDLRKYLADNGHFEVVIDLGSLAFRRAHVPASVIIWEKGKAGRNFHFVRLGKDMWDIAVKGDNGVITRAARNGRVSVINKDYGIEPKRSGKTVADQDYVSMLLDAGNDRHRVSLGDVAVLREGSHAIRAVSPGVKRNPGTEADYPVLIDKTMGSLRAPEVGFIRRPEVNRGGLEIHEGVRFLIRKTGDRLVAAPSPTDGFALAHQNVYVGKVIDNALPFSTLVGILASGPMTDLYRAGPGGQHHRPHAQFRILFLKSLPVIIVPREFRDNMDDCKGEAMQAIEMAKAGRPFDDEPVPVEFPSDSTESGAIARKINILHEAIELITEEIIRDDNETLRRALDILVTQLYGGKFVK